MVSRSDTGKRNLRGNASERRASANPWGASHREAKKPSPRTEGLLTCGEFAKLCQVKKQTLFHYDDIGILKPEIVGDNGYRYYTYRQYETFAIIANLKTAGLSLAEIGEYLEGKDSRERLQTLRDAEAKIQERITELTQVQTALLTEIGRAEEAQAAYTKDIILMHVPTLELIRSTDLNALDDEQMIQAVQVFSRTVEVACAAIGTDSVRAGELDRYSFLLAYRPELTDEQLANVSLRGAELIPYTRPAGIYAVAYHKGSFDTTEKTYARLIDFFDRNGFVMGPLAYEEYLRNELTASSDEDYLTRIVIQVARVRP